LNDELGYDVIVGGIDMARSTSTAQNAILLCHAIINNPTRVKAAIGGRAGIGFPFKNIA